MIWVEFFLEIMVFVFIIDIRVCRGRLVTKPQHVISLAGETVTFHCSSDIQDQSFIWYWSYARQPHVVEIFDGGDTTNMGQRFKFNEYTHDGKVNCDLSIEKIKMDDGGSVMCKDDGGFGDQMTARLSVLEGEPTCDYNSTTSLLIVNCSFRYWGELDLIPDWDIGLHGNISTLPYNKTETNQKQIGIIEHLVCLDLGLNLSQWSDLNINVTLKDSSQNGASWYYTIKESRFSLDSDRTTSINHLISDASLGQSTTTGKSALNNTSVLAMALPVSVCFSIVVAIVCVCVCRTRK